VRGLAYKDFSSGSMTPCGKMADETAKIGNIWDWREFVPTSQELALACSRAAEPPPPKRPRCGPAIRRALT